MAEETPTTLAAASIEGNYAGVIDEGPNHRSYHSRLRILEDGYQVQSGKAGVAFVSAGVPVCAMLELALSVPGVAAAQVTAHQLDVWKSPLFLWAEIDAHLVPLFAGTQLALGHGGESQPGRRELQPWYQF